MSKYITTQKTTVYNCEGTSTDTPPTKTTSWFDALMKTYAKLNLKPNFLECIVSSRHPSFVNPSDIVGAHVHQKGETVQYIIPLCKYHNAQNSSFELDLKDDVTIIQKSLIISTLEK